MRELSRRKWVTVPTFFSSLFLRLLYARGVLRPAGEHSEIAEKPKGNQKTFGAIPRYE
jgi:hypothetical protein